MRECRRLILGLCCFIAAVTGGRAQADGAPELHGFASQGLVHTTDNQVHGNSTAGSLDFRELGLGGSWRPRANWLLAAQVLSRQDGEAANGEPVLDYALVDFMPLPQLPCHPGLSLGRIRNPFGLYNDSRDVAFSRPGISLPQTVYLDKVRDLFLSMDGVQLHTDHRLGDHGLQVQLNLGKEHFDDDTARIMLGNAFAGSADSDGITWVGRLLYDWHHQLQLGLSAGRGFFTYDAPRLGLSQAEGDARLWLLSAQYHAEQWTLTAEYVQQEVEAAGVMPFFSVDTLSPEGWYVQGDYRFTPRWEAFLRYEDGRADRHFRDRLGDSPVFYTRGWVTGLRWDPHPQWMLRLEYGLYDGGFILSNLDNQDPAAVVQRWNIFSALLAFRF
ncbi:MAG: hypothetical protein BWK76_16480 [Desulfobulbaceae bacterium A2]|nr:MAG: hypothetical protein BWK76_16480 [Desulfobulbaceae bacterium A2]